MTDPARVELVNIVRGIIRELDFVSSHITEGQFLVARGKLQDAISDIQDLARKLSPRHCEKCGKIRGPHTC